MDSAEIEKTTVFKSIKKKQTNRIGKWRGDYCMLASCYKDALEHYTYTSEKCKTAGDLIWQAGSEEGWIAATIFIKEKEKSFDSDIANKYPEVINLYSKAKANILAIEACIKLASYYSSFDKKTESSSFLCRCLEFASVLTGQEKVNFSSLLNLALKLSFSQDTDDECNCLSILQDGIPQKVCLLYVPNSDSLPENSPKSNTGAHALTDI